jgi:ribose/xylose/arabinose/galactoside ABC-type transport system permease subunit
VGLRDRTAQVTFPGPSRAAALGRRILLSEYFVLYLAIAYFVVLIPFVPDIASTSNFESLFSNMWPLLVIAIGQTFVLITAGIDLSQTAVMGLVSIVGAALITQAVQPDIFQQTPLWGPLIDESGGLLNGVAGALPIAIVVMVLIGALVGLLNGSAVTRLGMPPFMVTLVTLTFFTAVAIWLSKSERIGGLPLSFLDLSERELGGLAVGPLSITTSFAIAAGVAVVAHLVLSRTVFGRWMYAMGTNVETAIVSGVPVARTITWAYVISGACAALGGLLYSARLGIGQPNLGSDGQVLLDIIGATVIGGTSLYGGRGKVLWTVFGVFFYVLLANSLNLMNLSFYTVTIVKGSVILAAVVLDTTRRRLATRTRRAAPAVTPAAAEASS